MMRLIELFDITAHEISLTGSWWFYINTKSQNKINGNIKLQ